MLNIRFDNDGQTVISVDGRRVGMVQKLSVKVEASTTQKQIKMDIVRVASLGEEVDKTAQENINALKEHGVKVNEYWVTLPGGDHAE